VTSRAGDGILYLHANKLESTRIAVSPIPYGLGTDPFAGIMLKSLTIYIKHLGQPCDKVHERYVSLCDYRMEIVKENEEN
jgi:hypothetical protein